MSADEPETQAGAANDATEIVDDHRLWDAASAQAWSDADEAGDGGLLRQPWSVVTGQAAVLISVGAAVAAITVMTGWLMFHQDRPASSPLPPTSAAERSASLTAAAPLPPQPAGAVPPAPITSLPPSAPEISRAGFFGEWDQHSTSVTLAPDGSAHYAVWSGVANGASWSATWSPMTSTTAMIVMVKQLESHGDTSNRWLHRYPGEALTFTLRPDGYATITNPSDEPMTLCPQNIGFRDTKGLCGA